MFSITSCEDKKDSKKAKAFREEGNEFYKKKNMFEALVHYNKSLALAEPFSNEISLNYANRSAVYLEKKLYDYCLHNIELARANGYIKTDVLDARESKCIDAIAKKAVSTEDDFKLSHPANPKIPFASCCLKLMENETFGRHIITDQGKFTISSKFLN